MLETEALLELESRRRIVFIRLIYLESPSGFSSLGRLDGVGSDMVAVFRFRWISLTTHVTEMATDLGYQSCCGGCSRRRDVAPGGEWRRTEFNSSPEVERR